MRALLVARGWSAGGLAEPHPETTMVDIIEVAAADARPLRRGAPSIHVLDESPDALHLGALQDGELVGVVSALPMKPDGEADPRWLQLLGPFGQAGAVLVEALLARMTRDVTVWADSPRPGLDPHDGVWQRVVKRPTEPPEAYSARDIVVLEGLTAVRLRPGMYVGSTGPAGVQHLVEEVVNNVIDEHLAGHATRLGIDSGPDGVWTVTDDGRGIPTAALGPVCLQLNARQGVGLAVVNALSAWMVVETHRDGVQTQTILARGRMLQAPQVLGPTERTGTTVRFRPDPGVFGDARATNVRSWLERPAAMVPELTVVLDGQHVSRSRRR